MWWVNDTMNLPTYAVGRIGAFLSPEWSTTQRNFNLLAQSARQATDMWQDYNSTAYALWRMAPALAAAPLAPAAAAPAWTLTAVETAWVMAPALWWQASFWNSLPSWDWDRREVMRQQSLARKQQIANSLSRWQNQWVNFNDSRIKPLIQRLILEYNSLN